jgi:hypothetical protein
MEMPMPNNIDVNDTSGFSFQVDLLNLNLHLAEKEKAPESQTRAHEVALAHLRTMSNRA